MELLSTGFAFLALAACVFLTWQCNSYAREARDARNELQKSVGKLASHSLTLEDVQHQLRRLNGRVSQMKQGPRRAVDDYDDLPREDPAAHLNGDIDPALAAELALQSAPPVRPGS